MKIAMERLLKVRVKKPQKQRFKKREGKEGKNWKLKLMSLWTMHEKNKTRENE